MFGEGCVTISADIHYQSRGIWLAHCQMRTRISIRDTKFDGNESWISSEISSLWRPAGFACHPLPRSANTPTSCEEDRRKKTRRKGKSRISIFADSRRAGARALNRHDKDLISCAPRARMDDVAKYKVNYLTHCRDANERAHRRLNIDASRFRFQTGMDSSADKSGRGINRDEISADLSRACFFLFFFFTKFSVFAAAKHVTVLDRYSNLTRGIQATFARNNSVRARLRCNNEMLLRTIARVQQRRD